MHCSTEPMVGLAAERIVHLRNRLDAETDPSQRREIEIELDFERRALAHLLYEEGRGASGWTGFRMSHDADGTYALRLRDHILPVNSAYLEHMLKERRVTLRTGSEMIVSAELAQDAIVEAIASMNYAIASIEALKRRLAFFHRVAEALTPQGVRKEETAA